MENIEGDDIMKDTYDDIINLKYDGVKNHKKMSVYNRSAQFTPFAALTGYDDAISEKARLTDKKIELSNEMIERLDLKINMLKECIDTLPIVKITHFVKDEKKSGCSYQILDGRIKKIKSYEYYIMMDNKVIIYIKDIYDIESKIFNTLEF
ncbi:MAG: hypothetical protein ACK5LC_15175 [Coprobacillaceae bacterium]